MTSDGCLPQRKTLKALRAQWEVELLRVLRETKATLGRQAYDGQPTLYPFLCLLSEAEFVSTLMQVGRVWGRRAWGGRPRVQTVTAGAPRTAGAAGAARAG